MFCGIVRQPISRFASTHHHHMAFRYVQSITILISLKQSICITNIFVVEMKAYSYIIKSESSKHKESSRKRRMLLHYYYYLSFTKLLYVIYTKSHIIYVRWIDLTFLLPLLCSRNLLAISYCCNRAICDSYFFVVVL